MDQQSHGQIITVSMTFMAAKNHFVPVAFSFAKRLMIVGWQWGSSLLLTRLLYVNWVYFGLYSNAEYTEFLTIKFRLVKT